MVESERNLAGKNLGGRVLRRRSRIRRAIRLVWIAAGLSFTLWLILNMGATGFPETVLASDTEVRVVREGDATLFQPRDRDVTPTLLFLPGALVDPDAYAPIARALSERGYSVVIQEVPWRMAPFEGQREALFERMLARFESMGRDRRWIVAGHSRGGALAAEFTHRYPDDVDQLILIGTSHPKELDLTRYGGRVVKVSGSRDGLASPEEIREYARNLPLHTNYLEIEGANHAQFGWYGTQLGDNEATISREEQTEWVVDAIVGYRAK